jgi:hypothetical protein
MTAQFKLVDLNLFLNCENLYENKNVKLNSKVILFSKIKLEKILFLGSFFLIG